MSDGIVISAFAGSALAALYSVAALGLGKIAMRSSRRNFMMIVMGGMMARLFVAIIILTLALLFAPVHKVAFLLGFFVIFVIGLTLEILTLHRQQLSKEEAGITGGSTE